MNHSAFLWVAAAVLLLFPPLAPADVRLPALFSDNMVLQRDAAVPVWGWATDGEKVSVTFRDQEVSAVAEAGRWEVQLAPTAAGGPYTMSVAGENTITIKNVLVGENWVCGGQSNMAMPVSRTTGAAAAIEAADHPEIRLFRVQVAAADAPKADAGGSWVVCTPETVADFSGVGYYFGRDLQGHLRVPVGLIQACVGGTNASSWLTRETLAETPALREILENFEEDVERFPEAQAHFEAERVAHAARMAEARERGAELTPSERRAPRAPMGPEHPKRPSALYNGMIAPLQPFAVRGAIWYQGEANAQTTASAAQYHTLFPALIRDWRAGWGQDRFPFLFVQLAAYGDNPAWPLLRDAQTAALALPDTGMAVAIDVGDRDDIHPADKAPIGNRLMQSARNVAYGEPVAAVGPLFHEVEFRDNLAILSFRYASDGLKSRAQPLTGFSIAGPDGVFVPADAAIGGLNVIVRSPHVPNPAAVRYGWEAFPDPPCTLYSGDGRPAVPFRTDSFSLAE